MGLTLTSLSVLFPVVILVSGIADGVHLLEYYAQRRYEGLRKEDAIAQMIEDLSGTSFWTSLTTIVGFAAIFVLPTAALRDFAFLIMIGSVFALINNLLLLPLLLNISKSAIPGPRQHSMTFLAQTFYLVIQSFQGPPRHSSVHLNRLPLWSARLKSTIFL